MVNSVYTAVRIFEITAVLMLLHKIHQFGEGLDTWGKSCQQTLFIAGDFSSIGEFCKYLVRIFEITAVLMLLHKIHQFGKGLDTWGKSCQQTLFIAIISHHSVLIIHQIGEFILHKVITWWDFSPRF